MFHMVLGNLNFEDIRFIANLIKKNTINVLVIPYANPVIVQNEDLDSEIINKLYGKKVDNFSYVNPHKKFIGVIADGSITDINPYIKKADIIIVPGGDGDVLKQALLDRKIDLTKIDMNGKVYTGVSAGANLLSTCYYSNDNGRVDFGLGYINIATMSHYTSKKFIQLNALISEANKYKSLVITINDGENIYVTS